MPEWPNKSFNPLWTRPSFSLNGLTNLGGFISVSIRFGRGLLSHGLRFVCEPISWSFNPLWTRPSFSRSSLENRGVVGTFQSALDAAFFLTLVLAMLLRVGLGFNPLWTRPSFSLMTSTHVGSYEEVSIRFGRGLLSHNLCAQVSSFYKEFQSALDAAFFLTVSTLISMFSQVCVPYLPYPSSPDPEWYQSSQLFPHKVNVFSECEPQHVIRPPFPPISFQFTNCLQAVPQCVVLP